MEHGQLSICWQGGFGAATWRHGGPWPRWPPGSCRDLARYHQRFGPGIDGVGNSWRLYLYDTTTPQMNTDHLTLFKYYHVTCAHDVSCNRHACSNFRDGFMYFPISSHWLWCLVSLTMSSYICIALHCYDVLTVCFGFYQYSSHTCWCWSPVNDSYNQGAILEIF